MDDYYIPCLRLEIETLDQAEKWMLAALILGVINQKFDVGIQLREGYNFTPNLWRATGLVSGKCARDPKVLLPIVLELLEIQEEEIGPTQTQANSTLSQMKRTGLC